MDSPATAFYEHRTGLMPGSIKRRQEPAYFILAVLGFSFWFFMAVPFASHRETYWWMAMVHSQPFAYALSFISSSYRPLAQAAVWTNFLFLDPGVFPTSTVRMALLQTAVYGMFVLAWWLIFSAATQRRAFALIALVAGGVFFSGYIHLFHIYGNVYVPPMLVLGLLIYLNASGTFSKHEVWLAGGTTLFVLWHPFTTALFVGYYFGYYVDTFSIRRKAQHLQAVLILAVGLMAIAAFLIVLPRFSPNASALFIETATRPLGTRFLGFLASYQTNEVNRVASLVAFLLALSVLAGMRLSSGLKWLACSLASALGVVFTLNGVPLLLLWVAAVLFKLLCLRFWSLFFLMLAASLFPFGGGIGGPTYALFAIVIAVYVTPIGWTRAEEYLATVETRYVLGAVVGALAILVSIRMGIDVPVVSKAATPLLAERERTFQFERILAWLRDSEYCGYEIGFVEKSGSPVDSVESVIDRRQRPPAALEDAELYWKTALQCKKDEQSEGSARTAIVTFGETALAHARPVFKLAGRYAGDATVWIASTQAR